jgi:hypothetical protein
MTDLIVVPQAAHWQRLKRLVLDSVSSPITRRVYNLGLDEFFEWYGREPRPGFTKATVSAWRVALEARGLGAVSINVRITAVRKLAVSIVLIARGHVSISCNAFQRRNRKASGTTGRARLITLRGTVTPRSAAVPHSVCPPRLRAGHWLRPTGLSRLRKNACF